MADPMMGYLHTTECGRYQLDIGDFMMVTGLRRWWQNHVRDFINVKNRPPTSIGHQNKPSPTSVTNIDDRCSLECEPV